MKIEQVFAEKYPDLFVGLTDRKSPMSYGINISEGWYPLLERVCDQLTALGIPGLAFAQVKEKFGSLRIYTNRGSDPVVNAILDAAEEESRSICEFCGNPGELDHTHNWVKTRCSLCKK